MTPKDPHKLRKEILELQTELTTMMKHPQDYHPHDIAAAQKDLDQMHDAWHNSGLWVNCDLGLDK